MGGGEALHSHKVFALINPLTPATPVKATTAEANVDLERNRIVRNGDEEDEGKRKMRSVERVTFSLLRERKDR